MAGARLTTITTPQGHSSKALTSTQRQRISLEQVQNPGQLTQFLQNLQDAQDDTTRTLTGNPHASPNIVRKVALTNGQVKVVTHVLGRPFTGWWICRVWPTGSGAFALPTELQAGDAGYPHGVGAASALVLKGRSTDVVDICISGD